MPPEDEFDKLWKRLSAALHRGVGRGGAAIVAGVGLFALYPDEMIRGAAGAVLTLIIARELR